MLAVMIMVATTTERPRCAHCVCCRCVPSGSLSPLSSLLCSLRVLWWRSLSRRATQIIRRGRPLLALRRRVCNCSALLHAPPPAPCCCRRGSLYTTSFLTPFFVVARSAFSWTLCAARTLPPPVASLVHVAPPSPNPASPLHSNLHAVKKQEQASFLPLVQADWQGRAVPCRAAKSTSTSESEAAPSHFCWSTRARRLQGRTLQPWAPDAKSI